MMKRSLWTTFAGWSLPEHTGISDDLDLLIHALSPAPGLQFLSMSSYGAGEAALALAASGASTVWVYDIGDANMIRRLIHLKISAAGVLSHKEYLALMDWDLNTAKPSKNKLLELGLEDVAQVLWP